MGRIWSKVRKKSFRVWYILLPDENSRYKVDDVHLGYSRAWEHSILSQIFPAQGPSDSIYASVINKDSFDYIRAGIAGICFSTLALTGPRRRFAFSPCNRNLASSEMSSLRLIDIKRQRSLVFEAILATFRSEPAQKVIAPTQQKLHRIQITSVIGKCMLLHRFRFAKERLVKAMAYRLAGNSGIAQQSKQKRYIKLLSSVL